MSDPTIEPIIEGRPTIRLVRDLPHSIERVWRAVTEPAELDQWFVGTVPWTPAVGEEFEVMEQLVRVTEVEPPRTLAWQWGQERYRFDLEERGDGTRLTFLHVFTPDFGPGEQHAAGWQVYFGRLASLLGGHPVDELVAHAQAVTIEVDGRPALRFFRTLEHPVEQVWEAVTTPEGLGRWFPCSVDVDDLRVGARMTFDFAPDFQLDGEVRELDTPRLFDFRWGEDGIRIELLPLGDGARTLLSFTHVLSEGEDAVAKNAAGWHVCIDALQRGLEDPDAELAPPGRTSEWEAHYDAYVARGYPAGAPIPAG